MVDGLPARLVHPHLQARHAGTVREHDPHLPCSWRRGHRWFVEIIKNWSCDDSLMCSPDTIWNHMTKLDSGIGVAGSSTWAASLCDCNPSLGLICAAYDSQISLTTTIPASTWTRIFTIAASSLTTPSSTMTTRPRCGHASLMDLQSTHLRFGSILLPR